ncbi:MAG: response regulator [Pseudomonadota bacterium]
MMTTYTTAPSTMALSGRSVLVVEDEFLIAMELEMVLEEVGARPVIAASIPDAEAALPDGVDAAILDVHLGGETTLDLAARLAAQGIPFVFQSGHVRPDDLTPGLDAPILSKPVRAEQVAAELSRLLQAAA